jgi:two-component system sensor histidine kinase QseC
MNKATAGRSLRLRLLLGFVWPTVLIWLVLAGWAVVDALHLGHAVLEKELTSYARQVLVVADTFRDDPVRLAQAIRAIEQVDNEAERLGDLNGVDRTRIQVWIGDRLLVPVAELPSERPAALPVYRDLFPDAKREARWGSVVQQRAATAEGQPTVTVRVAIRNTGRVALLWPSLGLVVVPLLVCLPLLLVPAWVMTRHGLRPLDALVQEISARVASGALTRLPPVGYRELQPVIEAMNRLLERLEGQLLRERGFVADVAHEMKTPLAILRSNLDTLRSSRDPARRETAQRDLHTGLDRASHLIGQLLRMARLEADAPVERARAVDLAEFIRERVAVLVPLADARGQVLEVEMPEALPGHFDVEAVGAIVDNLIDNAIKYADPDSVFHVELRVVDTVGGAADGTKGAAVLTITDDGPGIDPLLRSAALTRFGRAGRQDSAGAGLGLSIVQRAAARLGGVLTLEVAPGGRGLRAEVRFPLAGSAADQNAAA